MMSTIKKVTSSIESFIRGGGARIEYLSKEKFGYVYSSEKQRSDLASNIKNESDVSKYTPREHVDIQLKWNVFKLDAIPPWAILDKTGLSVIEIHGDNERQFLEPIPQSVKINPNDINSIYMEITVPSKLIYTKDQSANVELAPGSYLFRRARVYDTVNQKVLES